MSTRTVTTKEELKSAQKDKIDEIIVTGKLAEDLIAAQKITKLGKGALAALSTGITAAAVASPLTGGASMGVTAAALAPVAAASGISVGAILLIYTLGVTVIIALFNDYQVIAEHTGEIFRVILKKK